MVKIFCKIQSAITASTLTEKKAIYDRLGVWVCAAANWRICLVSGLMLSASTLRVPGTNTGQWCSRLNWNSPEAGPASGTRTIRRLDPDVLEAFRREGSGWQARINEVLREHIQRRSR